MPIYELLCGKCKKISEHLMDYDDTELEVECPKCNAILTRKANRTYTNPPNLVGVRNTRLDR